MNKAQAFILENKEISTIPQLKKKLKELGVEFEITTGEKESLARGLLGGAASKTKIKVLIVDGEEYRLQRHKRIAGKGHKLVPVDYDRIFRMIQRKHK